MAYFKSKHSGLKEEKIQILLKALEKQGIKIKADTDK